MILIFYKNLALSNKIIIIMILITLINFKKIKHNTQKIIKIIYIKHKIY